MDIISFLMGREDGERHVELSGDITCTDDGEGNVEVTTDGE
jgi:hypothetical protein